jgi:hypothetical protein
MRYADGMKAKLSSDKVVCVDCDDTLIMWDISKYQDQLPSVDIECYGYVTQVLLNTKNINLVEKFAKLGYQIIIWSQTGHEWAEAVGKACGLDEYVALYMAKPRYHFDDLPASAWMGTRIWRDPITGDSEDVYAESKANRSR